MCWVDRSLEHSIHQIQIIKWTTTEEIKGLTMDYTFNGKGVDLTATEPMLGKSGDEMQY